MIPAELALSALRRNLDAIARANDADGLRGLLCGRDLPALGSGEEPAEQLLQALETPPYDRGLARRVTHLCARLLDQRFAELERQSELEQSWAASGGAVVAAQAAPPAALDDEPYVYNLMLLASRLPRTAEPFEALYRFHQHGFALAVLATGGGRSLRQLRRALSNQQTDARLKDYWLSRLAAAAPDAPWDGARRSELLEAWRGVVWLPRPSANGPPIDLDAADEGLRRLHDTVADRLEGVRLLRMALLRMADAVPLDPGTWVKLLAPYWSRWPQLLQDVAAETWPALEPRPLAALPMLPADLAELWDRLDEATRAGLLEALNTGDAQRGRRVLNDLLFAPPTLPGCPPQDVRQRINRLIHLLWPAKAHAPDIDTQMDDRDWQAEAADADARPAKPVDRLAALETINRGLAAVKHCLEQDDEARARSYLDDLIKQQTAQQLPDTDIHVAKTLSRAATIARDAGLLDWAEALQRDACRRNRNDPVAAAGLADVLKARGELDAAERLYRDTVARWPNNVFAATGLADVLKARGELDAAERQYRENIARWPNNEVAANGLAEVLKARGELDAAERQYRENIARWPNNEVAASGLAEVLKARGEFDAAERLYRENIARWPNDEVAASGLAEVLKARGELDAAERQYRENIARWPNDEVAANGLSEVLKGRGELDAAERQYRQNIARWPNNEVAASGLAEVLKARGELDAAERQYRANTERWPNDAVARHGLANLLRKLRRHAEALQLVADPGTPVTTHDLYDLHLRGMVLLELGRWPESVDAFQRGLAAAKAPDPVGAFRRGLVLTELGRRDFQAAVRDLEQLPRGVARLDLFRLHAHAGLGDRQQARQLRERIETELVRLDFNARQVLQRLDTAYCLDSETGPCEPDAASYAALIDAEIDMEQAA